MKAPDKIYVHTGAHLGLLTLTTIPVGGPAEQEYIRKDALIEWAKECKLDVADDVSHGDAFACGYNCGMNELIEKINLL